MDKKYSVIILLSIIMLIPIASISGTSDSIPVWVKNTAGWWADGSVDDETFVEAIKFLIENDIISITEKSESVIEKKIRALDVSFVSKSTAVPGTIHFVKVIVTNNELGISGAKITASIISPTDEIIKTLKGKSNASGELILSIPITEDFEKGTYKINVKADRRGFSPVIDSFSFRVI